MTDMQSVVNRTLHSALLALAGLLVCALAPVQAQTGPIEELSAFPSDKLEISVR